MRRSGNGFKSKSRARNSRFDGFVLELNRCLLMVAIGLASIYAITFITIHDEARPAFDFAIWAG